MRDNIGLAGGGVALATGDLSIIGPSEGEILVVLGEKRTHKTAQYQRMLRETLINEFPSDQFWYQPADIVTQVLNQGLAAPINVQIVGRQRDSNYALAQRLASEIRQIPGASERPGGPGGRRARDFFQRRSSASAGSRAHATQRRLGPPSLPQLELSVGAELLARSDERRQLFDPGADAAVQRCGRWKTWR